MSDLVERLHRSRWWTKKIANESGLNILDEAIAKIESQDKHIEGLEQRVTDLLLIMKTQREIIEEYRQETDK